MPVLSLLPIGSYLENMAHHYLPYQVSFRHLVVGQYQGRKHEMNLAIYHRQLCRDHHNFYNLYGFCRNIAASFRTKHSRAGAFYFRYSVCDRFQLMFLLISIRNFWYSLRVMMRLVLVFGCHIYIGIATNDHGQNIFLEAGMGRQLQ